MVPPLIWTEVAVAARILGALEISMTPPFSNNHFMSGANGVLIEHAVRILRFFVAPICPPVGVSLVQKYPT
jgi:hypothetical protein